jgi:hypothetical protein
MRTHAMDLRKNTDTAYWNSRRETVRCALEKPNLFSKCELRYLSKRFPFEGPSLGTCAFLWAKAIGHRDRMAELIKEHGKAEHRVRFAFEIDTYKQKMKKTISTAEGAYLWSKAFPEDSGEFIDLVQGGKWAFRWAKNIGDEEKMKSRISTTYWEMMFDKKIKDNENVSFSSARNRLH